MLDHLVLSHSSWIFGPDKDMLMMITIMSFYFSVWVISPDLYSNCWIDLSLSASRPGRQWLLFKPPSLWCWLTAAWAAQHRVALSGSALTHHAGSRRGPLLELWPLQEVSSAAAPSPHGGRTWCLLQGFCPDELCAAVLALYLSALRPPTLSQ